MEAEGGKDKPRVDAGGRPASCSHRQAAWQGQEEAFIRHQREEEMTWDELPVDVVVQDLGAKANLAVTVK